MAKIRSKKGMTLIEIVMAIVIVASVVTGLSFYIKNIVDLYNFVTFRSEIASSGRLALSRMIREIRQCSSPTEAAGNISVADAHGFTFIDVTGATIAYSLSGTNLMRNSDVLAANVSALNFTYYDLNSAVLTGVPLSVTDCMNVVRVGVQIQVSYGGQSLTIGSQTFLRNY
jgi:prepilin-type N-terminal cleavage/methylation domain-containing protein